MGEFPYPGNQELTIPAFLTSAKSFCSFAVLFCFAYSAGGETFLGIAVLSQLRN
jgi:hypothetical protein